MLQNAVHSNMELRQVKMQASQFEIQTGKTLSYDEYCNLLLSAAQQYDMQNGSKISKLPKRRIYDHEIEDVTYNGTSNDHFYDIDYPIDVNMTKFNQGPRLTYEQWHALPKEAQQIWDMLSPEAKAIILHPPAKPNVQKPGQFGNRFGQKKPQSALPPRCTVNQHDIDYVIACLHELHGGDTPPSDSSDALGTPSNYTEQQPSDGATSVPEITNDHVSQPLLAHMTKKKPLPPGNIKRLMSADNNKVFQKSDKPPPHEFNIDGKTYRQVNATSITYTISACSANQNREALVDRGANGGIAGSDVRVINRTGRQVDIQGIDNHRITEIPIVTAGGH